MNELDRRRNLSRANIDKILAQLNASPGLVHGKACVYATGSYGRLEATDSSDLDLFIVGLPSSADNECHGDTGETRPRRHLNRLDEITVKAELIKATRELELPDFDGDGEYLRHYTGLDLLQNLGRPEDDVENTLTARLLLLLESEPILGKEVYNRVVGDVVATYWRDYADHSDEFVPTFFVNDVLRLWRTFCVNYEAKTKQEPRRLKLKRRVKNYKLKHNRMLTCFSAILSLLVKYREQQTVRPQDLIDIVNMTPTRRLEWVQEKLSGDVAYRNIENLLSAYDAFLEKSKIGEEALIDEFEDKTKHREYIKEATDFGDLMFSTLKSVGDDSTLFRQLMV